MVKKIVDFIKDLPPMQIMVVMSQAIMQLQINNHWFTIT